MGIQVINVFQYHQFNQDEKYKTKFDKKKTVAN